MLAGSGPDLLSNSPYGARGPVVVP